MYQLPRQRARTRGHPCMQTHSSLACNEKHALPIPSLLAEQAVPLPEEFLPPLVLGFRAHEHLAPDLVFHLALLRESIVRADLHNTLPAQLHLLILIANGGTRVLLVDDVLARRLPPLPALLLSDGRLQLFELSVDLAQRLGYGFAGACGAVPAFVLHAAAHLSEAQALHRLIRMLIIRVAANDDRGAGLTVEGWLQQHRQLGVEEGGAGQIAPALLEALLALVKRMDAALQGEKALVNVVCLGDALAATVILLPRNPGDLLVASFQSARRLDALVGAALAHPFGASQVHEEQGGLHGGPAARCPLAQPQDHHDMRPGAALVHRGARLAFVLLAPLEDGRKGLAVRHGLLAPPLKDVTMAHALIRGAVRADVPPEQVADVVAKDLDVACSEGDFEAGGATRLYACQDLVPDARHEALPVAASRHLRAGRPVRAEKGVSLAAAGLAVHDQGAIHAIQEVQRQPQTAMLVEVLLRCNLAKYMVEVPVAHADPW
mmetsp:Transcript_66189/g.209248  ORF Transcript_66189/g.209248 Transcript_66189/m.209248 type:complete len:491 (+) Transcript_66189:91-1563(+)